MAGAPIVVGAGWSGIACAVELVRQGHRPILLDAAPAAGGRARAFAHDLGGTTLPLDNGQHLLIGAYRETLALLRTVGVAPRAAFACLPFELGYPDGWRLRAAALPAPWHLGLGILRARGMAWTERLALARWCAAQRRAGWTLARDLPALGLFDELPPALVQRLWRPLCLAALNVDLPQASAQVLLNVLRDSLGAEAAASRLLLPRCDLSSLLPDAAVAWLRARGAEVRLRTPVLGLRWYGAAPPALRLRDGELRGAALVLALPPQRCAPLLQSGPPAAAAAAAALARIDSAPIATTYLRYAPGRRLARPLYVLLDEPAREAYGQWIFDRGAIDPRLDGVMSVVVSGSGPHLDLSRAQLGERIAAQLTRELGLPAPIAHLTVLEKQATIAPTVGLQRPPARLAHPGLWLAADSAHSPYPSTLEGSVRSGIAAAREAGARLR